jgi:hypothetical protein
MKRIVLAIICLVSACYVAPAQTECESMLEDANAFYKDGNYVKAAKMYKLIQEDCGGVEERLRDCNNKIKEEADFNECTTLEACNNYLENYPDGRYIDQVQQIRADLIKVNVNAAEDDKAYRECVDKEDYLEYIKKYPSGRHVGQARAAVKRFEEDEAFENCYTESDCDLYLKTYPNGRYYSTVRARKEAFEAERVRKEREAAKSAYMNIRKVEFANTHPGGTVISDYGSSFYISDIQYLTPRISYEGLLDETKLITIYYKIYRPDGKLMYKTESPFGYTLSHIFNVQPGYYNHYDLPAWGSDKSGYYVAGKYKFELWFEGSRVYQTSFEVVDRSNALSRGNWRTPLKKCCDNVSTDFGNGMWYKGQFENGRRSGLGLYTWKGADFYIGSWDAGKKNGIGMEITPKDIAMKNLPECEYFVGDFSFDKKSGMGSCYDKYGNLIYWGTLANDMPTQNYPMTGYESYKFECIAYTGGEYYVGETFGGKPHGVGIYIWSNGDLWYGEWKSGKRHGYGIRMYYGGAVSSEIWEDGIQQ